MIKNLKKAFNKTNKFIIAFLVIIFSFLSYLSIPALYEYDSLQKELSKKTLEEFNLNLSLSNEIKYHIFPSPNFTIYDNLLSFDENKIEKFGELKKVKIFISIQNLFYQKKLKIREIKFYDSNFTINKQNFEYFNQYLKTKNSNNIEIINSKVFFKNNENSETLSIATITSGNIKFDKKRNQKIFNSNGYIFNTNYSLELVQSLENIKLKNLILNFKDINLKIKNSLSLISNEKIIGLTDIDFLREKIKFKYDILGSKVTFETKKNSNLKLSGVIDQSPFHFNIKISFSNVNFKSVMSVINKLKNYLNDNYLLNKNFNGKLLINFDKINGSKYLDNMEISASFINGKINLDDSKINLEKLGDIHLGQFNIFRKKNQIFIETKNTFTISNLAQFNRVIQLPKNKKKNIETIYFEIDKVLSTENFFIKKLVLNKNIDKSKFEKMDLSKNIESKNIENVNNWFDLKSLVRELLTEIN